MVNTRLSNNKVHDDDYHGLNGHDDHIDSAIDTEEQERILDDDEGSITRQAATLQNDSDKKSEDHDNNDGNKKESKTEHSVKSPKGFPRAVVSLYDYAANHHGHEHDSMTRRSLRNLPQGRTTKLGSKGRDRNMRDTYVGIDRHSRKIKDSLGYKRYGRSLIRKSDRQPKKLFETFNEVEIQKTIERKHREMLALQEASMYDGIKRRREISGEETQEDSEEEEEEEEEETEDEDDEDEEEQSPGYFLRKTKPKTKMYQAPPLVPTRTRKVMYAGPNSPIHRMKRMRRIPQHASSPNHQGYKRRRASSTSSSDDETAFERRKSKSMLKSRSRCLPMNFKPDDIVGVLKNRERAHKGMAVGSSLADVDPMTIDNKITFAEIGGLDHHVRALKEMIIFPLLYTEVFEKFNITPPRGVLFYGPPGTGKTLVARALANECSTDGRKVAFFMRKGADCLSKWVGESERQLRLLFDQAYSMRPSIIFFDEIDGIAPVRSTRQDQIHSSIVSTLLALMDGLDARGEIVVIGATNRLDAIDPALRRPGRFDREFLFSLPNKKGREKIFEIHTASWQPKLSHDFIVELADKCVGYCGADIKALCTETALFALRRRYPQIYESTKKLKLDTNEIKVSSIDFKNAMKRITPASHRSARSLGLALPDNMKSLLSNVIKKCIDLLHSMFPPGKEVKDFSIVDDIDLEKDDGRNIFERGSSRQRYSSSRDSDTNSYFNSGKGKINKNVTNRPRLLLHGEEGNGQSSYIAPALIYSMEHLTTHGLDLPSLYSNSCRTPEETVAQIFCEARRTVPCIIYLPHIGVWWQSVSDTTRATFLTLLQDLPSGIPVLFLATAEEQLSSLPEPVQNLFSTINNELTEVLCPDSSERHAYFKEVLLDYALQKPEVEKQKENESRRREVLREASPPKRRDLSAQESKALLQEEESVLRELRLFLREITWKLLADRKYKEFSKPVDLQEVDDYMEVIGEPMDLSTVMTRINSHYYHSCAHFLKDIDLIMNNCLEYNPDKDQFDKFIRNRACEMRDVAHGLVHNVLDPDFEKTCMEIHESRKEREHNKPVLRCDHTIKALSQNYCAFCEVIYDKKNEKEDWLECKACDQWYHERCFCKYSPRGGGKGYSEKAPPFLKMMPKPPKSSQLNTSQLSNSSNTPNYLSQPKPSVNIPDPTGSRYSRRVRGLSESNKSVEDLNQVLSRKRMKVMTNETCGDSYDNALSDCLNTSDQDEAPAEGLCQHNNTEETNSKGTNENTNNEICPSDEVQGVKRSLEFGNPSKSNKALTDFEEAELLLNKLVEYTHNYSVESLGRVYTTLSRTILKHAEEENRCDVLEEVGEVIEKLA